jgi:hypothetical protein
MITETATVDLEGRSIVVQRANDDADRAHLVHEATMLALARHPGVVEIIRRDADGGELVTAGGQPFRSRSGRPEQALPTLAAVGEIVADLHSLGLVHGAIDDDAIIISPDGRPRLGRFGRAGLAGHATEDGTILRPSLDVEALAGMVSAVVDDSPSPSTIRRRRRSHSGQPSGLSRVLAAGRTGQWPPARRLAQAIEAEIAARYPPAEERARIDPLTIQRPTAGDRVPVGPASPTPSPADDPVAAAAPVDPFATLRPSPPETRRWPPPRLASIVAAMVGVMAITWGALGLTAARSRSTGRASTPTTDAGRRTPSTSSPARSTLAPVVTAGGPVTIGDVRYSIGQPSDQVAVAEWACADSPTALVLRPVTGELFAFGGWATAGHDIVARPAGHLAPGSRLSLTRDTKGCAVLTGIEPGGTRTTIDPDPPR